MSTLPQPTKYTNRELGIIISEMANNIKSMNDGFEKLSNIVTDLGKYKERMDGKFKATIFWTSLICSVVLSLVTYSFNLTIQNLEQRLDNKFEEKLKYSEKSTRDYIDGREFIITK